MGMMIEMLLAWCYRKETVPYFQTDPNGEIILPPGCSIETEVHKTDFLSDPIVTRTVVRITPRRWFRPINSFLR